MSMKTAISRTKAKRNFIKQKAAILQTRAAVGRSKHGRPLFIGKVKQAAATQGK